MSWLSSDAESRALMQDLSTARARGVVPKRDFNWLDYQNEIALTAFIIAVICLIIYYFKRKK